jgi:hypothetical protein
MFLYEVGQYGGDYFLEVSLAGYSPAVDSLPGPLAGRLNNYTSTTKKLAGCVKCFDVAINNVKAHVKTIGPAFIPAKIEGAFSINVPSYVLCSYHAVKYIIEL